MNALSSDGGEGLGLQRLGHRLKLLSALEAHERDSRWRLAQPGSQLAIDDAATRPHQVSHLVGHCLAVSLDALTGARMLIQDPEVENGIRLLMIAPYAMLRTAIEAGALANWVLMSADPAERISRTFRARWADIVSDDKLVLAFTAEQGGDTGETVSQKQRQRRENARRTRAQKNRLRAVSDAAGIDRDVVQQGLPGFGPLVARSASTIGIDPNLAHGLWRAVSGLTHPSVSRSLSMSSREFLGSPEPGVQHALLSANPTLLNTAVEAALLLHTSLLGRTAELGGNSSVEFVAPESISAPPT